MCLKKMDELFDIDRFRRGEPDAFNFTFTLYYSPLYLFAYNLIRNEEEAKDIVNDSYVALWKKHWDFDSLDSIKNFLFVVTRNKCMDYFRFLKRKRIFQAEFSKLNDQEITEQRAEEEMINAQVINEIAQRIEGLPLRTREIVKLVYLQNKKCEEIAEEFDTTAKNISNIKRYGIRKLKDWWDKRNFF